jgi:phage/plasmid-like protein (TIGR03299 family)
MAHRIESTDNLLLVGERAWHGLGIVIPTSVPIREGFRRAVPWNPVLEPIFQGYTEPGHVAPVVTTRPVPDAMGVVARLYGERDRYLATVGADYRLVTHEDVLALAEAAEQSSPDVKLETVGTTHGGRRLFLLLRIGSYGLGLNREDRTSTYLALLNSFDGSTALRGFGTEVRVVCANTYAAALGAADAESVGFRVLHSGADIRDRLDVARSAIATGQLQLARLEEGNRVLADRAMTIGSVGQYFGRVASILFPAVATDRPTDPKEGEAWERQRERARETVGQWVQEFEHERQALVSGTAYAALESVTYWADHLRPRVRDTAADRLTGRGARIKFQARELALAMAG